METKPPLVAALLSVLIFEARFPCILLSSLFRPLLSWLVFSLSIAAFNNSPWLQHFQDAPHADRRCPKTGFACKLFNAWAFGLNSFIQCH
ncbi:hypothetical protein SISNIDRAFT_350862 [Sistotremastrum niveocremeum HHB9708]|uniref:Uncharacterized protein n=1 Tax=Sistotremastrum niveocremeum HHB9708 TaxID=1314777 RepID=A0A164WZF5_9AGAM|nr:hypothetical protein SISNIDRAFT_350862 [Sistotremastrum niveocremeum HHB9708]